MPTLPDWIGPNLRILSVGLNPSPLSLREGFPFANPQNRFWRALNASNLVDEVLMPSPAAMERLFKRYRIGFTDIVKRSTPGAAQLRAADFRLGAPQLTDKILRCAPRLVWIHGKLAYRAWLAHGGLDIDATMTEPDWGLQALRVGTSRLFVTPNPSPANASYSLDDLIDWYRRLAELCR